MTKFSVLSLLIILFSCTQINGQTTRVACKKDLKKIQKYEVLDIVFNSKKNAKAPFEVEFGAVFTSPSGTNMNISGFYNGGKEWLLRFSANEIGSWSYTTYSSLKQLNNKTGKVVVNKAKVNKHGGIVIDKNNSKKFAYEDGSPYFIQSFEADWLFALDYNNVEATPKTEHLLNLFAKNGFNQIVTTMYSYEVRWDKDKKLAAHPEHEFGGRDDIYPFLGNNKNPNHSSLNVTFFQRFDRVINLMNERDIVAHLMVYVWNKKVNWPKTGSLEDNRYFDYVIKRYSAFSNVIWNVSKEAFRHEKSYMLGRVNRTRELDAYNRLVTIHDFSEKETLDFISLQNWKSEIYTHMLDEYKENNKPVLNIEHGGYEQSTYVVFPGDYTNPELCLRRNYMSYFAGVYANYYWQDIAWNVMVHNPFELGNDFVKPKLEYYKHLKDFFTRVDYQKFNPEPSKNRSGYCLKSRDEEYLYYIPKENYQLSNYSKKGIGVKKGTVQWFNTLTGEYSELKNYNGGHFKNPFHGMGDAILIRNLNK